MRLASNRILIIFAVCLFSSCATLFNAEDTNITLIGDHNIKFVVNGDSSLSNVEKFSVERSKNPLSITILKNDTLVKTSAVNSTVSKTFYLNFLVVYGLVGCLIDYNKPKMFSYPDFLFFDHERSRFVKARPKSLELPEKNKILFKISPLNMVFNVSNPSLMIGAEIKNNSSLSTNFYFGYGFPALSYFTDDYQNFRFIIEQRKYLRNIVFNGTYVGFEVDYFRSTYSNTLNYRSMNEFRVGDDVYEEDRFYFSKTVLNLSGKLGYQFNFGKTYLDFISGVGLRQKQTVVNDDPNYRVYFNRWHHPRIQDFNNELGSRIGVNISAGLRLGF